MCYPEFICLETVLLFKFNEEDIRMSLKYKISRIALKIGAIVSCAVILESSLLGGTLTAYATNATSWNCTVDDSGHWNCTCGANKHMDVSKWNQGYDGYGDPSKTDPVSAAWASQNIGGGVMSQCGCLVMSFAILLKMSGAYGDDFCPVALINYMNRHGCFNGGGAWSNYAAVYDLKTPDGKTPLKDGGGIVQISGSYNLDGASKSLSSHKDYYDLAVALAEKGYYVITNRTSPSCHFTPLIKLIDVGGEKRIIISEVGDGYDDLTKGAYIPYAGEAPPEGYFNYNYSINHIEVFVVDGHPFTGAVEGGAVKDNANAPTMKGLYKFLEEDYFVTKSMLDEAAINLPRRGDLIQLSGGWDKVKEIESWKSNIDNSKENSINRYIRASFMFVGILITLYSMLLYVAYQFDRINNFVDISLLSTMTVGRLNVAPEDTNGNFNSATSGRAKYLKHKDIIIVSIIGVGIGVLLISGRIFSLMWGIKEFLDKLFG